MKHHTFIALMLVAGNALSAEAIEKPAVPAAEPASSAPTSADAQAGPCDCSAAESAPSRDTDGSATPKRMPRKARQ